MLKSLSEEKHRTIVRNLEYLDENMVDKNESKFKRSKKEMTKDDFIEYQRQRALNEFEILRTEPRICTLIKQIHFHEVDQQEFPYVEAPKASKHHKKEKKLAKGAETFQASGKDGRKHGENSMLDNPRIFVFVLGGLSHHEMCCMAELQNNLPAQIIPGSNEIITPKMFLKQLENLHKVDIRKLRQGDSSELDSAQFMGVQGFEQMTEASFFEEEEF